MSLITPDFGLFFWMTVVFIIVFTILKKKGFPVITAMVNERKAFIDASLQKAHEANEKLANIKKEGESILQEAREKQAHRIIEEARLQIANEKQNAIKDVKGQVASISVQIAEKILHNKLSDSDCQMDLIDSILKDVSVQK